MSRSALTLLVVAAGVVVAPLSATAGGAPTDPRPSKQEVRVLMLRGQALNRSYGAGSNHTVTLRRQPLVSSRVASSVGPTAQEVQALMARGEAMNKAYHLGTYADTTGNSFSWSIVAVVAASAFAAILLAFGTAVAVHRRHGAIPV